jgi:methyl-accepting chemotaxis protein
MASLAPSALLRQTASDVIVGSDQGRNTSPLSFFRYHGIWAPGVRLFRRLSFQAKALIVSIAFLIPLFVLGWSFDAGKRSELDFVVAERQGVAYAAPLMQLSMALLHERQLARVAARGAVVPSLPAAREQTRQAWASLLVQHGLVGAALDDAEPFKLAEQSYKATQGHTGAQADQIYAAYTNAAQAQSALLEWVIDKSNLALDPEFSSYYLMDALMIAAPDLALSASKLRALMGNAIKAGSANSQELVAIDRESETVARRVDQLAASLGKAFKDAPELARTMHLEQVQSAAVAFMAMADGVVQGKPLPLDAVEVIRLGNATVMATETLLHQGLPMLDDMLAQREQHLSGARIAVDGMTLLCVLMAGYLLYCFYRVTRGGMEEVRHHLSAMTDGDLTTQPRPWGHDEAASLMHTLSDMQRALRSVVRNVREASDVIVHSSAEIACGAMDLSARTENMAASLQASASAMDQVSVTVCQTADHAVQAATLAQDNADVAFKGGEVIGQVVNTMQDIHQSSNKIADIINVINGIAFQTNILALNAAVEAARAGTQGRGFAVVASEVRALAKRSATAAQQIGALINESVSKVASGSQVVQSAGLTMGDIVGNAQRMNGLLSDIATAAREQSIGVGTIGQSVQELDRVTQENAALVEETAAASASLKQQAMALAQAVSAFRLPA